MTHAFQIMSNTSLQSIFAINGAHRHIIIKTNWFHTHGPSKGIKMDDIPMKRGATRCYVQKWHKYGVNYASKDRSALLHALC